MNDIKISTGITDMNRHTTWILLIALILVSSIGMASAFPGIPSTCYGNVAINGSAAPDGTMVSGWISGVEKASQSITGGTYDIDVYGTTGDTIVLKIYDAEVETVPFKTGANPKDIALTDTQVNTSAQPDALPPSTTTTFVLINWTTDSGSDTTGLSHYELLRATNAGGPFASINVTSDTTQTTYNDTGLNDTGLSNGAYYYRLRTYDKVGNVGNATEDVNTTIDTTDPVVNTVDLNTTTPNTGDAILVTVNATDYVGVTSVAADGVELTSQGGNIWNGTIIADVGYHSVNVSAVDAAGNTGWNNSTGYTDATPPTVAITALTGGQTFTTATITVSGTASDNVGLSKVEVKVGESGSWQTASGTTSWTASVTLASGSNTIYARATDTSGNPKETSVTVTYTPSDTTAPTIAITSPTDGQTFTTATITVSGTASDNVGLSKVEVKVGESGSWQTASGTTSWTASVTLASGSNTIYARATDTSGNPKETSVTVTYDGELTTADAVTVLQMAVRGEYSKDADVNGDSHVTSVDALMILQRLAIRDEQ